MVSIGTLIEEEIKIMVPVKRAFETLALCCRVVHVPHVTGSCTFHTDMGWDLSASNEVCLKCSFLVELAGENV